MSGRSVATSRSHRSTRSSATTKTTKSVHDDNPISIFAATISHLPTEEWKAKTIAMEKLVAALNDELAAEDNDNMTGITEGVAEEEDEEDAHSLSTSNSKSTTLRSTSLSKLARSRKGLGNKSVSRRAAPSSSSSLSVSSAKSSTTTAMTTFIATNGTNTLTSSILHPTSLRNLAYPFRTLLNDLRALVVKAACATLSTVCEMLGDRASLLLKDIVSSILGLHAQTVKVMHGYAESAMRTILPHTKSRSAVAVFLKEAKSNKSKEVRCISLLYIDQVLLSWPLGYFTKDKPLHILIGTQLAKSLLDPSQQVRVQARKTLVETYRRYFPQEFREIVSDTKGPLAKDIRTKKSILAQVAKEKMEQLQQTTDEHPVDNSKGEELHLPRKEVRKKSSRRISSSGSVSSTGYHTEDSTKAPKSRLTKPSRRAIPSRTTRSKKKSNTLSYDYVSDISSVNSNHSEPSFAPRASPNSKPSSLPKYNPGSRNGVKNPFSSITMSLSPKDTTTKRRSKSTTNDTHRKNSILIENALMEKSACAIQAAVRGMIIRGKILKRFQGELRTQSTKNDSSHIFVPASPEVTMLRECQRALADHITENKSAATPVQNLSRLGLTAKEMAVRRKTGADVLPLTPSTMASSTATTPLSSNQNNRFHNSLLGTPPSSPLHDEEDMLVSPSRSVINYVIKSPAEIDGVINDVIKSPAEIDGVINDDVDNSINNDSNIESSMPASNSPEIPAPTQNSKQRLRNRQSLCLKETLRKSQAHLLSNSLIGGEQTYTDDNSKALMIRSLTEELLAAHKQHIDQIMAVLSDEMDIVRVCEDKLEESFNEGLLTEEDLLEYFEGVSSCLERRDSEGEELNRVMERVSRGGVQT